jgi:SRSO17 transposase
VEMLEKISSEGVIPFRYVAADSIYGNSPEFLDAVEKLTGVTYFVSLPRDTLCWLQEPTAMDKSYRYGGSRGQNASFRKTKKSLLPLKRLPGKLTTTSGIDVQYPRGPKDL